MSMDVHPSLCTAVGVSSAALARPKLNWPLSSQMAKAPPALTQSCLKGHNDSVLCLSSSSTALLASGSEDCTARLWDLERSPPRSVRLMKCGDEVTSVCFGAPDSSSSHLFFAAAGQRVLTFDLRNSAVLLDASRGGCQHVCTENADEINQLAASRDGSLIGACDDTGAVKLYDTQSPVLRASLHGLHENLCNTVQFCPPAPAWAAEQFSLLGGLNHRRILSGGLDARLVTWGSKSKGHNHQANEHDEYVAVRETKVGLHALEGGAGGAGALQGSRLMNPPFVYSVAFSPDGSYFGAGLGDGTLGFYSDLLVPFVAASPDASSISAHRFLGRIAAHGAAVNQVHFLPFCSASASSDCDGAGATPRTPLLATAGDDLAIKVWQCNSERRALSELVPVPPPRSASKPDCAFCGKIGTGVKKCKRCMQVHYCNGKCMKAAWKGHKAACKTLAKSFDFAKNKNNDRDASPPHPPGSASEFECGVGAGTGARGEGEGEDYAAEGDTSSGCSSSSSSSSSNLCVTTKVKPSLAVRVGHGVKVNWLCSSAHGSGSLFVADTSSIVHVYSGMSRL